MTLSPRRDDAGDLAASSKASTEYCSAPAHTRCSFSIIPASFSWQRLSSRCCDRCRAAALTPVGSRLLLPVSSNRSKSYFGKSQHSRGARWSDTEAKKFSSAADPDSLHCAQVNPVGGFLFVQGFDKWVWICMWIFFFFFFFFERHMLLKAHLSKWFILFFSTSDMYFLTMFYFAILVSAFCLFSSLLLNVYNK